MDSNDQQKSSLLANLLRFLKVILEKKAFIFVFTCVPTLVSIVIVLIVEETYVSNALVKPPADLGSPISLLSSGTSGFDDLLGDFMDQPSGEDDCISILSSVRFASNIIDEFNLEKVYEFDRKSKFYKADVIRTFRENFSFELNDEDAIEIQLRSKSPELSKNILEYAIVLLDSLYLQIQKEGKVQNFEYIDSVLIATESQMKALEDSLIAFQLKNKVFIPDLQFEATLKEAGTLGMQISNLEEDLLVEEELRGRNSPKYKKKEKELRVLERLFREKFNAENDSSKLSIPLNLMPHIGAKYFQLERGYGIKLNVYKFLVKQSELLKLEIGKNIRQISVIDPPWLNTKKIAPARRVIVQIVFAMSLIISIAITVIIYVFSENKKKNSETWQLAQEVYKNLLKFR